MPWKESRNQNNRVKDEHCYCALRGLKCTFNAGLSQKLNSIWSSAQSLLSGASSISKLKMIRASIRRNSTNARLNQQVSHHRSQAGFSPETETRWKEYLLHPNAVPRSVREGLENVLVVVVEATVVQPAVRDERVWVEEVGRVVVDDPLPDSESGLRV